MSIFYIFGLFFGVMLWAGIASLVLKRVFKQTNPRLLNTISVAVAALVPPPRAIDDEFLVTLMLTVPAWLLLEYFDRQEHTRANKKASQPTPSTDSD
ncbi:MAG: hypothetical protein M3R02_03235 [Chloroflexota bacterium]|nr:hypothetical protein [Chloroflexota bacterium]